MKWIKTGLIAALTLGLNVAKANTPSNCSSTQTNSNFPKRSDQNSRQVASNIFGPGQKAPSNSSSNTRTDKATN